MNYSLDHRLVKSGTHVTRFVFMSENNQSIRAFSVDSLLAQPYPINSCIVYSTVKYKTGFEDISIVKYEVRALKFHYCFTFIHASKYTN